MEAAMFWGKLRKSSLINQFTIVVYKNINVDSFFSFQYFDLI